MEEIERFICYDVDGNEYEVVHWQHPGLPFNGKQTRGPSEYLLSNGDHLLTVSGKADQFKLWDSGKLITRFVNG
jgi:hypothetical protein